MSVKFIRDVVPSKVLTKQKKKEKVFLLPHPKRLHFIHVKITVVQHLTRQ